MYILNMYSNMVISISVTGTLPCFLTLTLNVNVERFNQAQVNGGSNYDSLKVTKCFVI